MREKIKELLQMFVCLHHAQGIDVALEKLLDDIELEQRKAIRPFCVSLAEIGMGIIKDAQDTVWVGPGETALDRIFNELALEMDSREGEPLKQLKDFIEIGATSLWHEKLKETKSSQLDLFASNPKNET
jgi:hypothetical protein